MLLKGQIYKVFSFKNILLPIKYNRDSYGSK